MQNDNQKPHANVDYFEGLTGAIATTPATRVAEIGARIRSIVRFAARDKTTGITDAFCRDASCRSVNRKWSPLLPTFEEIPSQLVHGSETQWIVIGGRLVDV